MKTDLQRPPWRSVDAAIASRAVLILMVLIASIWLAYQFWRLLFQPDPMGAIDLKQRWVESNAWFKGEPVYGHIPTAVYPPASYLLLWPAIGWPDVQLARILWAGSTVVALAALCAIVSRAVATVSGVARRFFLILPLAIYGTGATIGNGQLLVHLMPVMLAALIMLRLPQTIRRDLAIAALFTIALIKPSATAPFFWILLLSSGGWRPALLVLLFYAGCTIASTGYQNGSAVELLADWIQRGQAGVAWGTQAGSYGNVSQLLFHLGLEQYTTIASIGVLLLCGIWKATHRRVDLWVIIGITAYIARFWTYHFWYDDLLLLLPLVTLYRLTITATTDRNRQTATILFVVNLVCLIAPGGLYLLPSPLKEVYTSFQVVSWIAALVFLMYVAYCDRLTVGSGNQTGRARMAELYSKLVDGRN